MYYCDKHKISQSIPESHACMYRKHEMSPTLRMVSEIDPSCRCTHLIFFQTVRKCQVQKIHVFGNINVSSPLQTLLSHTNTLTFITEGLIHCDAETNCEPQTASSLSFWPLGLVFRHKVWPCTTWLNVLFTMKSTSCARRSRQGKIGEDAICQRVARGRGRLQILLKKRHDTTVLTSCWVNVEVKIVDIWIVIASMYGHLSNLYPSSWLESHSCFRW